MKFSLIAYIVYVVYNICTAWEMDVVEMSGENLKEMSLVGYINIMRCQGEMSTTTKRCL